LAASFSFESNLQIWERKRSQAMGRQAVAISQEAKERISMKLEMIRQGDGSVWWRFRRIISLSDHLVHYG
jgi:hypothetical protein